MVSTIICRANWDLSARASDADELAELQAKSNEKQLLIDGDDDAFVKDRTQSKALTMDSPANMDDRQITFKEP